MHLTSAKVSRLEKVLNVFFSDLQRSIWQHRVGGRELSGGGGDQACASRGDEPVKDLFNHACLNAGRLGVVEDLDVG